MDPAAYVIATLVVLALFVAGAYAWYHAPGSWTPVSAKGGDAVTFSSGGAPLNRLRFRNCLFTTQNPAGQTVSWDVTGVLNGMAAAYDIPVRKSTLSLGGSNPVPLNPFSFVKPGFNDAATVPTQEASAAWASVPASATSLVGELRVV